MIVYLVTNTVNGKRYVGITTKTLPIRWRQHLRRASAGSRHSLHLALAKYGDDAFVAEVIGTAESFDALKALEVAEIARLGTFGQAGYNMTAGGDGAVGFAHTEAEREARRARRTGVKHTDDARAKIKAAHQNKKLSPEHIAALVAANTGRKMPLEHAERLRNRQVSEADRAARRKRAIGNKWSVGIKRTPEQCAAIGDRSRGREVSEDTRAKIRAKRATQAPTFGMLGKTRSTAAKAATSATLTGRKKSPETIERMREAARRRMAEGRNGAINR